MLYPLDLSSQRIFKQQKHNEGKRQAAKECIAIYKTQVLLQNVATPLHTIHFISDRKVFSEKQEIEIAHF